MIALNCATHVPVMLHLISADDSIYVGGRCLPQLEAALGFFARGARFIRCCSFRVHWCCGRFSVGWNRVLDCTASRLGCRCGSLYGVDQNSRGRGGQTELGPSVAATGRQC